MKYSTLAIPMMLLIIMLWFVGMTNWANDAHKDIIQRQYDLQVNYATDAATDALLVETQNTYADYDWESVVVDPRVAYQAFNAVLAANKGHNIEYYRDTIDQITAAFIVVGYDGFYAFTQYPEDAVETSYIGDTKLVTNMTPKIPYARLIGSKAYKLNLGFNEIQYISMKNPTAAPTITKTSVDEIGGVAVARYYITKQIQDAINNSVAVFLQANNEYNILLPAEATILQAAKPISNVTCIAVISDGEYTSYAVGANEIYKEPGYYAYELDGVKYYSHVGEFANTYPANARWYPSAKACAEAGYVYREVP